MNFLKLTLGPLIPDQPRIKNRGDLKYVSKDSFGFSNEEKNETNQS